MRIRRGKKIVTYCQVCSVELSGRIDKKFCSKVCSNVYHTERQQEINGVMKKTNAALARNTRILRGHCAGKSKAVSACSEALREAGFDFNFFTQLRILEDNRVTFVCYEFFYIVSDDMKTVEMGILDNLSPEEKSRFAKPFSRIP